MNESSSKNPQAWWITTGPLPAGGEKVLGPFCSQDLALKVRSYMEAAQRAAGDGRTYWVDDEGADEAPGPAS
jgi:hypothetical protein